MLNFFLRHKYVGGGIKKFLGYKIITRNSSDGLSLKFSSSSEKNYLIQMVAVAHLVKHRSGRQVQYAKLKLNETRVRGNYYR